MTETHLSQRARAPSATVLKVSLWRSKWTCPSSGVNKSGCLRAASALGFRDNLFHLQAKGWLLKIRKEMLMIRSQRGFTKKRDGLPVTCFFGGWGSMGFLSWELMVCSRQHSR